MPKFVDLPEALTAKDNDIICISDPDAQVSKKMTLAILKTEVAAPTAALGGTVAAVGLPVVGAAPTYLTAYAVVVDPLNITDAALGEIAITDTATKSYRLKGGMFVDADYSGNAEANNDYTLWAQVDDGTTTTDYRLGIDSFYVKDYNPFSFHVSGEVLASITGSPTTVVRMGINQPNGKASDVFNITNTVFVMEQL